MSKLILFTTLFFTSVFLHSKELNSIFVSGDKVTITGRFVIAKGTDKNESIVDYQAIKLDKPISIKTDGGTFDNIDYLKLWLDGMPAKTFIKYQKKHVQVTGIVDYYYFGPSAFINPAKFEVLKIEHLKK